MTATPTSTLRGARPRLILADDHRMVVEGLSTSLAHRHEIAGVAYGGDELLALLRSSPADCLLLDIEMSGHNGLQLIPAIRRLQPRLAILVVTMLVDRGLAAAALNAGASGFVPKDAPVCELELAIAEVIAGRQYVSDRVPKTSHRVGIDARHRGLHRLTPRQQQIVLLLGEGRSGSNIARALHVGPSTITFHKHNIMRILGIDDEPDLVRYAVLVRAGTTSQVVHARS